MENPEFYREDNIRKLAVHIAVGGFIAYYTLGVFNTCQKNVSASLNWGENEELFITIFSSFVSIGETIGSASTSFLIHKYGRRKTVITAEIIYMIGTIILVMPHTATFGIGRLVTGYAGGIYSTINGIFINEVTPVVYIPRMCPLYLIFRTLGLLASYAFGLMLPTKDFKDHENNELWIFMFLFPAAVAFYQFCYFFFFMKHDCPQFYFEKKRYEEEKAALAYVYTEAGMEVGLERVAHEIRGKMHEGEKLQMVSMIFKGRYTKMTRVAILLPIALQFCGITAIYFYSTKIFEHLGGGLFLARVITVCMGIVNMISAISSLYLLRFFGRKTIILTGVSLLGLDLLLLGLFSQYVENEIVLAIFLIAFYIPFGFSFGTTFWVYIAEVCNDQIMSLSVCVSFLFSVLVSFIFPLAVNTVGIYSAFYFFSICMAVTFIYMVPELIETKGKGKENILIEMKVLQELTVAPTLEKNNEEADGGKPVNTENVPDDSKLES